MPNPATLTVIMPVYNEAKTVREVIQRVVESPVDKEILIVDDCSTDGTRDILRSVEKTNPTKPGNTWRFFYQEKNQGKGAAIRRAIPEATGRVTIIQDADLEVNPAEYPSIIQPILEDRCDVVYGNRFHRGFQWGPGWGHYLGNKFLTEVSNIFSGMRLHDMETCYKAFRTPLLQSLPLRSDRFGFEPEVTSKVGRRRSRVQEVPISYISRSYKEGKKIGVRDALQAILIILKYWLINDSQKTSP
jgi:glycosyltransferase involved in cell wall biosynthesis